MFCGSDFQHMLQWNCRVTSFLTCACVCKHDYVCRSIIDHETKVTALLAKLTALENENAALQQKLAAPQKYLCEVASEFCGPGTKWMNGGCISSYDGMSNEELMSPKSPIN